MKLQSLVLLSSLTLAACGRTAAPDTPAAPPVAPIAQQSEIAAPDVASPNGLPMGKEYRDAVREWGRLYFANRSEAETFEVVKKNDMHYLYVAFLELYPRSAHRGEIQGLMQRFSLFDTEERTTIPVADLKRKYNYDGDNGVYAWNNAFAASVVHDKANRVWPAPLCYGNLQFLTGGFIHRRSALELLPGTQFIYRSAA
jgi:hypothetical protein